MPILPGPRMLSIQQPWAWAIACGRKKVENRSWSTPYRGVVFIHASSKLNRDGIDWLRSEMRLVAPPDLVQGAVIAVAEITDVVTRGRARRFGKWFSGKYGFVLKNVRPLRRPVRTLGKLGLFRPSPAVIRSVGRQLRRSPRRKVQKR